MNLPSMDFGKAKFCTQRGLCVKEYTRFFHFWFYRNTIDYLHSKVYSVCFARVLVSWRSTVVYCYLIHSFIEVSILVFERNFVMHIPQIHGTLYFFLLVWQDPQSLTNSLEFAKEQTAKNSQITCSRLLSINCDFLPITVEDPKNSKD